MTTKKIKKNTHNSNLCVTVDLHFLLCSEKVADDTMKAELDGIISGLGEYLDKIEKDEKKQKDDKMLEQREKEKLLREVEGLRSKCGKVF